MGFKENLKAELAYNGMLVKELAAKTDISRRTLDNYLRDTPASPTAENAVRIARVLGCSVEYLVTGKEGDGPSQESAAAIHHIVAVLRKLSRYDLETVLQLARRLEGKGRPHRPDSA